MKNSFSQNLINLKFIKSDFILKGLALPFLLLFISCMPKVENENRASTASIKSVLIDDSTGPVKATMTGSCPTDAKSFQVAVDGGSFTNALSSATTTNDGDVAASCVSGVFNITYQVPNPTTSRSIVFRIKTVAKNNTRSTEFPYVLNYVEPSGPATSVAVTSAGATSAGVCSGAIKISRKDATNRDTAKPAGATVVNVASTGVGFLYTANDCSGAPVIAATIPDGSKYTYLYYYSTTSETANFTATSVPLIAGAGSQVVNAATASSLFISLQPTNSVAGSVLATTPTIEVHDAFGNLVTGSTATISLAISANPGLSTLTGTNVSAGVASMNTVGGVAAFTGLVLDKVGAGYNLIASSPLLTSATTNNFNVTVGTPSASTSTITGTGPVTANGVATSTVTITLMDANSNPEVGITPTFTASGSNNGYGVCSATNASGVSTCTLTSTTAEVKTLTITAPVNKIGGTTTFTAGAVSAVTSTITGTGPVGADNIQTSTVTITLLDAFNNPISGTTPTFSATGGGNTYNACSATNASGISTCTMTSSVIGTKTLSIATPVVKADGTVLFTLVPNIANSTITGTTNIEADGISSSTVTITILDIASTPIPGITPTFAATDTGSTNVYGVCSVTNGAGVSTCTLKSTQAEVKNLQILTPVNKIDAAVTFIAPVITAGNSSITGTSPVVADGVATSTVTVTLKNINNFGVAGVTPTFTATDTGATNIYGVCSVTNALGVSTCTLASTHAEVKTLSIATPVVKVGGNVTFTAGAASVATSTITGTTPVEADGIATSTVTITLLDASSNPVSGITPTFSATGSNNNYNACSATNASGISTCTMTSTTAEVKTLSIATPIVKADGNVTFTSIIAVVANSSITGTTPVEADGIATSTVTITLKNVNNVALVGVTPTFTATGSNNNYNVCSATNAGGISTCTMTSTTAEVKTLSIATPLVKAGGNVTFTTMAASVANSTITGTGPVEADGVATSTVTITLKNVSNVAIVGVTPTFTATNTGASNVYGGCSATDASGISTCTLKSLNAEVKTLSIATPIVKADGTVTFTGMTPVIANSSITGTTPVEADGIATSTVTINLKNINNVGVPGITPTFTATGSNNSYNACSATNASGVSTCTMTSTTAEVKTLSIATPIVKADGNVTFTALTPVVANSSITGTGPVEADGVATSTVTINLKNVNNVAVVGVTPTFTATNTGASNVYGGCSATNASGDSTCTLKSLNAEVKTLSIATPIVKAGGTVTFTSLIAVVANSSISGTGPVTADGVASSTVTITLKNINNVAVQGVTPTFAATDTGVTNNYGVCSATNASGVSTCTLKSTHAEVKTLSITAPISLISGTVTFQAGAPAVATSTITGTSPVVADGVTTSTITITILDAFSNPISGTTPTFTSTGTGNSLGGCSATNASGISTCTMASTTAEVKTLSIATPVVKAGGNVTFTQVPSAVFSSITGTGSVEADGVASSTVTITLKDVGNAAIVGVVPTFTATDTGATNNYGVCSATNASGDSTCTLKSLNPEVKTLSIATPLVLSGGTVTFTAMVAVAATSTITGTTPVVADGVATSTISIYIKNVNSVGVSGITPTFTATDTGAGNIYGGCSATNASGLSTCTLASSKAETKTLSIATPFVKAGGNVVFQSGAPNATTSTITGTGPVEADGVATSTVTITLLDASSNPVSGVTPTFTSNGSNNTYNACSATNASGVSTCTMTSTTAEVKTLQILTPVSKFGGSVTFTAMTAVVANSSITGTTPVEADGIATSTVTVTLKNVNNVALVGVTPTFSATGSNNNYNACSATNAGGVSTCTMTSTTAEVKTLSIATPIVKAGGNVTFTALSAVIANSSITGTGPVEADGVATSTVTINLKNVNNVAVVGVTPTFTATNTGASNVYGGCSATNASGDSTCTLKSLNAEVKTLSIATPIVKAGGTVTFTAMTPVVANSSITGTGPVEADGVGTSTVTITLKNVNNVALVGVTPTFSATNTGASNVYGGCSATNASGDSTCTLQSLNAEVKTLSIATPLVKAGGTVTFTAIAAAVANSSITGTGPVEADGIATSTVTINLKNVNNVAVVGVTPTFTATNTGASNVYGGCSATNASGDSTCTLKSLNPEVKTLSIATPIVKAGGTVTFSTLTPVVANSSITGTGPVEADGVATSTVTINLKNVNNVAVVGVTPTFSATNTGASNVYGGCSATNASGDSTCTLKSLNPEVKTLSIATPLVKAGGTVTFTTLTPVVANSSITGTGPVEADGVATSTVTINLKNTNNVAVQGVTPTFTATNTGASNVYGGCSATNASGDSTCTLKSLNAEVKTLSITTPIVKAGGTVTFTTITAVIANSSISGTGPTTANGVATSTITVTLKNVNNVSVVGVTPTLTVGGTANTVNACSATNASGISTCTVSSTKAESKTLAIATPIVKAGANIVFQAGPAAIITKTAGDTQTVAAGTTLSNLQVRVTDANSNPVSGVTITNATGGTPTTDASGYSTLGGWTLTCPAGAKSLPNVSCAGCGNVTFTATATGSGAYDLSITGGNSQSGGAGSSISGLQVQVTDSCGTAVSGVPISKGANGSGYANTDGAGNSTGSINLTCSLGAQALNVTCPSCTNTNSVNFSATAVVGTPVTFSKTAGDNQTTTVNTAVGTNLQARVYDSCSNPVSGVSTGWGASDASGYVSSAWTPGCTIPTQTNMVTCTGCSGTPSVTFSATVNPGAPNSVTVTGGTGQNANINTTLGTSISVNVKDVCSNNVANGTNVTFTGGGGNGSAAPASTTTSSGNASTSWTLGATVGTQTLSIASGAANNSVTATGNNPAVPNIVWASCNFSGSYNANFDATCTINNTGTAASALSGFNITGADAASFSYISDTCGSVGASGSCTVTVRFLAGSAGATSGAKSATLNWTNTPAGGATSGALSATAAYTWSFTQTDVNIGYTVSGVQSGACTTKGGTVASFMTNNTTDGSWFYNVDMYGVCTCLDPVTIDLSGNITDCSGSTPQYNYWGNTGTYILPHWIQTGQSQPWVCCNPLPADPGCGNWGFDLINTYTCN